MTMLVGLTGGVASGKSTLAGFLARFGVPIIDADRLSHIVTDTDPEVIDALSQAFGPDILKDGKMDRARMRELVFHNKSALSTLEEIVHPALSKKITDAIQGMTGAYGVLDCALILERPALAMRVDKVVVVDTPDDLQIQRMASARHIPEGTARGIIASQCTREERLANADFVIPNTGSLEALEAEAHKLHQALLELSKSLGHQD